jgi:hypothetical protein
VLIDFEKQAAFVKVSSCLCLLSGRLLNKVASQNVDQYLMFGLVAMINGLFELGL